MYLIKELFSSSFTINALIVINLLVLIKALKA
jgi:hypothetical protein